jgi:transmembrane sensor
MNRHIKELHQKYLNNQISETDLVVLFQYFGQKENEALLKELIGEQLAVEHKEDANALAVHAIIDRVDFKLQQKLQENYIEFNRAMPVKAAVKPNKINWGFKYFAAAAVLLLILGAGLFFLVPNLKQSDLNSAPLVKNSTILPGKNRATLTLADGKVINLNGTKTGLVIDASKLSYSDGSKVGELSAAGGKQIIVSTPRGGNYQVNMPDGTKIWLNAASSVSFPATFSGAERSVKLVGEAYFEVAKMNRPFIVTTVTQQVKVLGTHFNINSYTDEASTKTTLLEGSVKVSSLSSNEFRLLSPGQQSTVSGSSLKVQEVNTESAVAWKDNKFMFDGNHIEGIMRQISRWYDVDVVFKGNISKETFVGKISKFEQLSQVLDLIELTGLVHFKVEGRRITVMP